MTTRKHIFTILHKSLFQVEKTMKMNSASMMKLLHVVSGETMFSAEPNRRNEWTGSQNGVSADNDAKVGELSLFCVTKKIED
jgi:hypothetical protein